MGLMNWFRRKTETRAATGERWDEALSFYLQGTDGNPAVSVETALQVSAVWACSTIIASSVGTLPVAVTRRKDGGKVVDHPIVSLLHRPNEFQVASAMRETLMLGALLTGNGIAVIQRDGAGQPIGLYPMRPGSSIIRRIGGEIVYSTRIDGQQFDFRGDQVIHLAGPSLDGLCGMSPLQAAARSSVSLSLSIADFSRRFFSSGANLGGWLIAPPGMSDASFDSFLRKFRAQYTGQDASFSVAPLPGGFKFEAKGVDPEKGQMNESREQAIREIARAYRVPVHLLGLTDGGASYSSIEAQNIAFVQHCLQNWVVKLELELARKLLREDEQDELRVKLNLDSLLRGTTVERYTAHNLALQAGWMSRNEVRALEDLPPVEGGDELLVPLNMSPANGQPNNPANPPAPPKPTDAGGQTSADPSPPDDAQTRRLLEATSRRLVTKETKAIQRAAKKFAGKTAEFDAWAREFYAEHRELILDSFADFEVEGDAAVAHLGSSPDDVRRAFADGKLDDLLAQFDARPGAVAQKLLAA